MILHTILARLERRWDRRGEANFTPEKDPDIRGLRLQRRQSERAEQHAIKHPPIDSLRDRMTVPAARGGLRG